MTNQSSGSSVGPQDEKQSRETGRERAHRLLDELINRVVARHQCTPTTITDLDDELRVFIKDNALRFAIGAEILTAASEEVRNG